MSYSFLQEKIESTESWRSLAGKFQRGRRAVVLGSPGALVALISNALGRRVRSEGKKALIICGDEAHAQSLQSDLELLTGTEIGYFAAYDKYFFSDPNQNHEARWQRLQSLERIIDNLSPITVSSIQSLVYPIVSRETFSQRIIHLKSNDTVDLNALVKLLVENGYEREYVVEEIGDMSVRGGILDFFPPTSYYPVRVEIDFDCINSIRYFDPNTQRSIEKVEEIYCTPPMNELVVGNGNNAIDRYTLLDYFDKDDLIILNEPTRFEKLGTDEIEKIHEYWDVNSNNQEQDKPDSEENTITSTAEFLELNEQIRQRAQVAFSWTPIEGREIVDFKGGDPPSIRRDLSTLSAEVQKFASQKQRYSVRIYCDNPGQVERLREFFDEEEGVLDPPVIEAGDFSGGFVLPEVHLAVLLDHQIFLREHAGRKRRKTSEPKKDSLFRNQPLSYGDFVVHEQYGIGKYVGLSHLQINGAEQECLKIHYEGNDSLFVSIDKLYQLERYSSQEGINPRLNRLGTTEWDRIKARTKKAIKSIAKDLIKVYAARKLKAGYAFKPDGQWQWELEGSFQYDETEDQLQVTEEIKQDMERNIPMDRVVCGDVGFGKTEVALRAAFKAAAEGKQVALLAPTTILVQQHYETFTNRMEKYPILINSLSRFRTAKEQKQVLEQLKKGTVDIVIGTHRLLSKDVEFKDLGLMIVDEEQRFGVTHKERLKMFRKEVDVLTMTATPIPRTLSMSLLGTRDLSTINIAPPNRLPVINEITPFNDTTIRNAILRELDRNGQVYFVHNRVQSIEGVADKLKRIIPGLRCGIAHGQMRERALESVMVDFMKGKYDCLVSTMIIESGLDIPNVNTILINNSHQLGLSQLYQLRGRVGRSHLQGYAYFMIPSFESLDDVAIRRLKTVRDHWELGSGLKVAMRDLEIRGAGNLLGREQSGHINAIGFDLYNKLVEEAVRELQADMPEHMHAGNQITPAPAIKLADIQTDVDSYIPDDYIEYGEFRTELYQRIGNAANIETLQELQDELIDRFGALPDPAQAVIDGSAIRLVAGKMGFSNVVLRANTLRVLFDTNFLDETVTRTLATQCVAACQYPIEFFQVPNFGMSITLNQKGSNQRLSAVKAFFSKVSENLDNETVNQ
jgi:transcription-repair coupling factor (superfamily II helicase)